MWDGLQSLEECQGQGQRRSSNCGFPNLSLGSRRPGKLPEKGKSPKVRRGCKRSLGPTEQKSPKSLVHCRKPPFAPVRRCNPMSHQCKRLSAGWVQNTCHPLLSTFGDFPLSGNFPGPWLPKPKLCLVYDTPKLRSKGSRGQWLE